MEAQLEIVPGDAVAGFVGRVRARPQEYREVIVCSPFLDDVTRASLRDIAVKAPSVRCGFRVITRKEAADALFAELPGGKRLWRRVIRHRNLLHAKVYLALARAHAQSEAIVTSANCTLDGMSLNDELGLRITGRTEMGRYLLAGLRRTLQTWIH
jgi:phosphatidylserine/phosphatidylglycerophosphate/cardiolipin synthase-like enzyme